MKIFILVMVALICFVIGTVLMFIHCQFEYTIGGEIAEIGSTIFYGAGTMILGVLIVFGLSSLFKWLAR